MDLELLRTFLEVNRTRHFGQAAEALHLTQAAISARIRLLETTLGVSLFDRVRRDIRLTPEGTRLVRYADLLIAEWRKARQDVAVGGFSQQLSIGGSLRLWDVLLQAWLHELRSIMPDLAIIAESHTPELLTRRLLDGVLDLGFMLEPSQLELLNIREVCPIRLILVSTVPDIAADATLARDDYIMVDWGLSFALEHRRQYPDAPEPRTRLAQAGMAINYIMKLGGSAYLPERLVSYELENGLLHTVPDGHVIERTAYAVYPVRSGRKALIEEALELFGK
jgi:DNA-binding transcriptional LysR family regulator